MKIAIAQINPIVGDLAGNVGKIAVYAQVSYQNGAELLVVPELALSGYSPEDLLLRDSFYSDCALALQQLADQLPSITAVVGYPLRVDKKYYNAAAVLRDGQLIAQYRKVNLPNDAVFDERRYFTPGNQACVFEHQGIKIGITICADIWEPEAAKMALDAGAQLLVVLNASPFHVNKQTERHDIVRTRIQETGLPVIYVNLVGGQDELVFDGHSFAMNRLGELVLQLPMFKEQLGYIDLQHGEPLAGEIAIADSLDAAVYQALCVGARDYVTKNGFPGVLLGLSGGIDSALTLAIAVDALGADKVQAVMMPSPYTAAMSVEDARQMAATLKVAYSELAIEPLFNAFLNTLATEFKGQAVDTTEENIQARIRGTLLMALSNKTGKIVLTTGNKSEMTVGYATLYGDMAGGFAVLKDVAKTLVYRLAKYRNQISPIIPERIITRAPSAELRPNQTDQDSLPSYEVLDAIMQAYVEENKSVEQMIEMGLATADIQKVVRLIKINEYKRRQAPVGIRITPRGFGKDWRYPITCYYPSNIK